MSYSRPLSSLTDEEDDYWEQSHTASAHKKQNFFDNDTDDMVSARRCLNETRADLKDDNDDDSLASLTVETNVPEPSTTILSNVTMSARYQPKGQSSPPKSFERVYPEESVEKFHEEATPPSVSSSHRRTPSSISDAVAASIKEPTKAEVAKLESKIKRLERQLENQRVGQMSAEDIIKRMLMGQDYVLQAFKTLEDKKHLLRLALKTHDGNTINTVVAFLHQTLSASIFQKVVVDLGACDHYISYLQQIGEISKAEDMSSMMGQSQDAAMNRLKAVFNITDLDSRINQLYRCYKSHFETDPLLTDDAVHVDFQLKLLQLQQIIEKADSDAEASNRNQVMRVHRRSTTLPFQPLMTTLFYCCFYHYELPSNQFASPQHLRENFKVSDLQYHWMAISALTKLKRWTQLEQLFAGKKWYGSPTMSSVIGFENVVKLLKRWKATPDIMDKYCSLISGEEERLMAAKKYGCQMTAVETLIAMKDRIQLVQYTKSSLQNGSAAYSKVKYALDNSSIKWKN